LEAVLFDWILFVLLTLYNICYDELQRQRKSNLQTGAAFQLSAKAKKNPLNSL